MKSSHTPKHTPGPWRLDTTNVVSANGTTVIDKGSILWNYGQGQSNARLIAAAPDLLEACKSLEEIATLINARQHANAPLRAEDWSELFYSCGKARSAISKAEGQS